MTTSTPDTLTIRALVIGGGVAGTTCAAALATYHSNMSVTLLDPAPAIRIATAISTITPTTSDINVMTQMPESWCKEYGITFLRGRAERLTSDTVYVDDGSERKFDVCCLATGARPVLPEGLKDKRFRDMIYMLRDTDSVDKLKNKLAGVKRVMIVGAGGIAMEVVYELVNCEVFWVVKGHIGGSFFDARLGARIAGVRDVGLDSEGSRGENEGSDKNEEVGIDQSGLVGSGVGPNWLGARDGPLLFNKDGEMISESSGGRLHGSGGGKRVKVINAEVRKLKESTKSDGVQVHLSNGSSVWCDIIIVGAGVRPNTEWASSSGVQRDEEDGGVITKCGCMETSVPNVYAAGDCTHMIAGGTNWSQMRVWSQAFIGGRAAAAGMGRVAGGGGYAGLEFEVFTHATRFFGKRVVLLGRFDEIDNGGKVYERWDNDEVVRVFVVDGRVRGAVLVGDVDCAEVLENLIISGLDVGFLGARIVEKEIELDEFFD